MVFPFSFKLIHFLVLLLFAKAHHAIEMETLHSLGISDNFYVSDIAVHFNRVFLALPRTVCNNNVTHPTLVEVPWRIEFNVILKSRMKYIEDQVWANCEDLQNAISLAKEGSKSKLWVLDQGNEFCTPKLMAYSLIHNSLLDDGIIKIENVPQKVLSTMVVEDGNTLGEHRAFVASAGDNAILVCYLSDLKCLKMGIFEENNFLRPIKAEFLSISKSESIMYLTGSNSIEVFALDLEQISHENWKSDKNNSILIVQFLGEKLGPSSALEIDIKNGLIYYLTRDFAIVRWNIDDKPMRAESHDVLAQSFTKMPYVSKVFTDTQGGVFALVNPFSLQECQKNNWVGKNTEQLERVVQIMKYHWVLDKFIQYF
ncbi:uncharacterized protein [Euwallacea fornicatus]|uniref:uncharacterized protein n=1 Tax=Euwallacea fornicatus TaxID=995702 RepID=UPI0033906B45